MKRLQIQSFTSSEDPAFRRASKMSESPTSPVFTLEKHEEYKQYLKKLSKEFYERLKNASKPQSKAKVDDFEIIKVLGTGSFAIVYLVKHLQLGKHYAMKALEKENILKLKQVDHCLAEKEILCAVHFPFLVNMEFFFKDNCYIFFILPFIAGGEMFYHLRKIGKFDEKVSIYYGAQVLLALEYLHSCNLAYRDLKPENIVIDTNGIAKLTDFGFCKTVIDRTWTLCGTPEYLAPEVILNKGYGLTADWWSYGVLIFEMNAGRPPFYAPEPMKIYEKVVTGKYRCPSHFSPNLKDLLQRTLQVDITKRYGNLRNGVFDFKSHPWYSTMDWGALLHGTIPAPLLPPVSHPGDCSNFETFIDEPLKTSPIPLYEQEFLLF